jgi:hypothetical protein
LRQHRSWWKKFVAEFDGQVQMITSDDVTPQDSTVYPSAGFVQMMSATVADRSSVECIEEIDEAFKRWWPDLLGATGYGLPGQRMLAVDYFTSESEARAGEQRQPPPEVAEAMPRWLGQMGNVEWLDLAQWWVARA